jgi:DMSO reductase family type II enzyme molybdopterin subunit
MEKKVLDRREFLKVLGVSSISLSLTKLAFNSTCQAETPEKVTGYIYRNWEDLYRKEWTWDKVGRGTHYGNCWYQLGCCFNIYVKDGIIVREEQAAEYPQTNPEVPDYNPRGCQKGSCYSERMYTRSRIKYPLKRLGKRGEGKWQRVSWDQALDEIADTMLEVIMKEGSDTIVWDVGTQLSIGNQGMGLFRLGNLLGTPILDTNTEIGDDRQGAGITLGKISFGSSIDDWFYSDLFFIWGANPFYTQIPNCHFFLEARYNGTKIIAISPDYNPSSIHADLWVPINVGTDAALALSIAQVIIEEQLYHKSFIREQTDMPLLVRKDNKRLLRASDLKKGGEEDQFYWFDLNSKSIKTVPQRSLALEGVLPALEGEYEVETELTPNQKIKVRPVFECLRERLKEYTPEKVEEITGIKPELIRRLAHEIAQAKSATFISSLNFGKFYYGILTERAQVLVLALCGHFGKKGSGFNSNPWLFPDAMDKFAVMQSPGIEGLKDYEKLLQPFIENFSKKGYTREMIIYEAARESYRRGDWVSAAFFWYIHGGLNELSKGMKWDRYLKRELADYAQEALDKGWQFVTPAPDKSPRILFEYGGNILRRVRGYTKLIDTLLPKLRLLITFDWRMSSTGLYSDFVLPTAGWYEKPDIKYNALFVPFAHVTNRIVDPLYESKPEWEIFCLLAKKLQEKARKKGITSFQDKFGQERNLDSVYDNLTFNEYYKPDDHEKLATDFIELSSNLKGISWKEFKEKGFAKFTSLGDNAACIGSACDIKANETSTPLVWHTEKKIPYPTLTRRMQFYIDQELFMELGEELPVHKEPPKIGGNYPLVITGGHTRWSIHSSWRDDFYMLRLQRGVPIMYMSVHDAQQRQIADGEEVEVKNDLNSFRIQAKVSPAVRPGQVIIYHAWENFQFKEGKMFQNLMPSPLNPTELAGGYFHLRPMFTCFQPGQNDRDTRVEVIKISST